MLAKLIRQSVYKTSTIKNLRLNPANEFICLREAFNKKEAEESAARFKTVAEKYNLKNQEVLDLLKFLWIDYKSLNKYLSNEECTVIHSKNANKWKESKFFTQGEDFDQWLTWAQAKYPEIAEYSKLHFGPERKKALEVLNDIFLKPDAKLGLNNTKIPHSLFKVILETRVKSYVTALKANTTIDQTLIGPIEKSLRELMDTVLVDPNLNCQLLRYYIDKSNGITHQIEAKTATSIKVVDSRDLFTKLDREIPKAKSVLELGKEEAVASEKVFDDMPAILENINKNIRGSAAYNFFDWIEDKKIILEATVQRNSVFTWYVLSSLFGCTFAYFLYQGDASTLTLLTLPVLMGYSLWRARVNKANNSYEYLVQMNINRDGKHLELFIKTTDNSITKIEGVPVSEFKLHKGNYTEELDLGGADKFLKEEDRLTSISLHNMRYAGVANDAYVATFGDRSVLVPFNYRGNSFILSKVFEGKDVKFD